MALTDSNVDTTMLVQPSGYGYGNGGGLGNAFGNEGFWLLFILLLLGNNGWNNGYGGGNGTTYVANDVQRGFDQATLTGGINGIQTGLCNGFAGVQQSLCNGFATVNGAIANGFAQSEISANTRQIADMNQNFATQTAIYQGVNGIQAQLAQNGYNSGSGIQDLKYTVATEACADRQAVTSALQDVTAQGVANTTAIMNVINGGIQSIKDQLCQDKIDAKNTEIANLRTQLNMQNLAASQNQQTAQILADNAAQTAMLMPKAPIPAYVVQNPNGCGCGTVYNGCGCGVA